MDYEAEKIQIERDKLAFEKTKLASEEKRATRNFMTVLVPLLVGFVTVAVGFLTTKQQASDQFQLELAKAVMSASTIAETYDRARLLKEMFPTQAANLAKGTDLKRSDAGVTPSQKELFRAMSARDMKPRQILDLYIALFPDDKEWTSREDIRKATDPLPN